VSFTTSCHNSYNKGYEMEQETQDHEGYGYTIPICDKEINLS